MSTKRLIALLTTSLATMGAGTARADPSVESTPPTEPPVLVAPVESPVPTTDVKPKKPARADNSGGTPTMAMRPDDPPSGAPVTSKSLNPFERVTSHCVLGGVVVDLPSSAVGSAELVRRTGGDTVVRSKPADPIRAALLLDVYPLNGERVDVGAALVLSPGDESYFYGIGGGVAMRFSKGLWLRVGVTYGVAKYQGLAPGVMDGMPLDTTETRVPTIDHYEWVLGGYAGFGYRFGN